MQKILLLISFLFTYSYSVTVPDCGGTCPANNYIQLYSVTGSTQYNDYRPPMVTECLSDTAFRTLEYSVHPANSSFTAVEIRNYVCQTCSTGTEYVSQTLTCQTPCVSPEVRDENGICNAPPLPECVLPEVLSDDNLTCVIPDSDNDGIPDHEDTDDDNDGYSDEQELLDGTDPLSDISNTGGGGDGGGLDSGYCPPGQYNTLGLDGFCICANGLPTINGECQTPECPLTNDNMPLRYEDISSDQCYSLFNAVLGFSVSYLTTDGLSCCYADTPKDLENPCPTNQIRNENGTCIDITNQDIFDDCGDGAYYSLEADGCVPYFSFEDNGTGVTADGSGLSSDGSTYEDGDDSYSGGGTESNATDLALLQYNNDEVNDMLSEYGDNVQGTFRDWITENTSDMFSLFSISIPTPQSCGCTDLPLNVDMSFFQYSGTAEICSPLDTLFSVMRPLLWFAFLVSTLFYFFRRS